MSGQVSQRIGKAIGGYYYSNFVSIPSCRGKSLNSRETNCTADGIQFQSPHVGASLSTPFLRSNALCYEFQSPHVGASLSTYEVSKMWGMILA